jgi:capsular polysaccharide biosynthesis protein
VSDSDRTVEFSLLQGGKPPRGSVQESSTRTNSTARPDLARPERSSAVGSDDGVDANMWSLDEGVPGDGDYTSADVGAGLASIGFILAALRRSATTWCLIGLLGFLGGLGYLVVRPPAHEATATILLAPGSYAGQSQDDQEIAQSRTVAAVALSSLHEHGSPESFTSAYTVLALTSRILTVTAKGKSDDIAVREANAVANAFLKVQTNLVQVQYRLWLAETRAQEAEEQGSINNITQQISRLTAQPVSQAQRARLASLEADRSEAQGELTSFEQVSAGTQASMLNTDTSTIVGSRLLDQAVPIPKSRKRTLIVYAGTGLLLGLALGMAIVAVRALVSDRLRRRDDIARTLGAPVKLSVGKLSTRRGYLGGRQPVGARNAEVQRIAAFLGTVPAVQDGGIANLAVVPMDGCDYAASWSLVSLARGCAEQGIRVAVIDLCSGSPAARLLGVTTPGVQVVREKGLKLLVAVPAPDDVAPAGPLGRDSGLSGHTDGSLAAGCASANLLLTLAHLDPAFDADFLAGWAQSAVVVIAAGRSPAEKINSLGQMIRLAGIRQVSAVVIEADKTDHSLGTVRAPAEDSSSQPD